LCPLWAYADSSALFRLVKEPAPGDESPEFQSADESAHSHTAKEDSHASSANPRLMRALLLAFGLLPALAAAERPNILLIFSDDHGYQALSAYGHGINETPNLDEGVNHRSTPTGFGDTSTAAREGAVTPGEAEPESRSIQNLVI
jgi:hypothetical protein